MYNQKLVASLKANGKILREFKDTVYCPFGAEYSILLKNLNTVRALVNVYIDGENQTPGGLVLNPHQEVDLQRSIKNGNLTEGNRFKFIERTGSVEQHRGIKLEDGIVRIEYQFEIARPVFQISDSYWKDESWKQNIGGTFRYTGSGTHNTLLNSTYGTTGATSGSMNINGVLRSADYSSGETMRAMASGATAEYMATNNITAQSAVHDGMATMDSYIPKNDNGITVPGSKSDQKFTTAYIGALDPQTHSIVLKILGETPDNEPVRKPITTKHKPKCVTCGKQNKHNAKFCTECGTALEIFA
jgi:hypothetical protein